tara:strand:+ start:340 stop:591 length:252 start_codon:yes stop_codon:yes gene_type:complete
MEGLFVIVLLSVLFFLGIIKSLSNTNKLQRRKSQQALTKSPKYIAEQEERKKKNNSLKNYMRDGEKIQMLILLVLATRQWKFI